MPHTRKSQTHRLNMAIAVLGEIVEILKATVQIVGQTDAEPIIERLQQIIDILPSYLDIRNEKLTEEEVISFVDPIQTSPLNNGEIICQPNQAELPDQSSPASS